MERSAAKAAMLGVFLALSAPMLCSQKLGANIKPDKVALSALHGGSAHAVKSSRCSSRKSDRLLLSPPALSEEDAVTMRVISGPGASSNYGGTLTRDFAVFSPDRSKFVITLKRGNLQNNTNEYSLLLYRTDQLSRSPKAVLLVSMSSSSNREAIKDVSWLGDSNTLLFLGEHPGERTQLYSVRCATRTVTKLSNHPANLVAYSADPSGDTVVYAAETPAQSVGSRRTLRYGFQVTDQPMADLIVGQIHDDERELYIWRPGARPRRLPVPRILGGKLWGQSGELSLSPDGQKLILKINLTTLPDVWREYREVWLHRGISQYRPNGTLSWVFRYGIVELQSARGQVLLDSPVSYADSDIKWSPDSRSVVLSGVFLPLRYGDPELEIRKTRTFAVEVEVSTLKYLKVTDEPLKLLGWDKKGMGLVFETTEPAGTGSQPAQVYFQRRDGHWDKVKGDSDRYETNPIITTEQGLNTPPRIVALAPESGKKQVLLELNPQFESLKLGRVEEVSFQGADNREVHAGLYFPPDYVAGRQYPLVLQTHGFDPSSFWIDGPYPTAFAAQALASTGMLVLQLPSSHDWVGTPEEAPKMAETFAAAIEYVQNRGIVDKDRIGIIGFSRTGFHVCYALTHAALHFAAAVVADGSDGGYSQYIQFLNASPYTASDSEAINGGLPFGPGIASWLQRSPEFALDRVQTPLLIQALNPRSLSFQWATFVGLKRLGKPVDLFYLPDAQHILQKPWDRLASQQGVVDWFAFWLVGREDPDPAKAQQYVRWRELRVLQSGKVGSHNRAHPENR